MFFNFFWVALSIFCNVYGVLKCWFFFYIKGLRGCWIDWLVWRLTTTIAHHYMHTMEMKKKNYKTRPWRPLWKRMWKKPTLNILITHVAKPTFDNNGVLVVWSQCLVNVMHQVMYTFTQYPCCSCEWALWENLCKHWIMVILMCTNITQETS